MANNVISNRYKYLVGIALESNRFTMCIYTYLVASTSLKVNLFCTSRKFLGSYHDIWTFNWWSQRPICFSEAKMVLIFQLNWRSLWLDENIISFLNIYQIVMFKASDLSKDSFCFSPPISCFYSPLFIGYKTVGFFSYHLKCWVCLS